jgi:hypothetical protein
MKNHLENLNDSLKQIASALERIESKLTREGKTARELPTHCSIKEASTHLGITENAIRWLIFKADARMEACLLRNSRRILINLERFQRFLETISLEKKEEKKKKKRPNSPISPHLEH